MIVDTHDAPLNREALDQLMHMRFTRLTIDAFVVGTVF